MKTKPFDISIDGLILRFYLMMIVVLLGFFLHQFWLIALALPIFISGILGFSFRKEGDKEK